MNRRAHHHREHSRPAPRLPGIGALQRIGQDRPLAVMAIFLVLTFLMGGASRPDVASLAFLRPLSALVLGYGLLGLEWPAPGPRRWVLGLALAIVALPLVHLTPLPPGWAAALPGRAVLGPIDALAGLSSQWRPLSLAPAATRNALWSLMAPAAVLVLGLRLQRAALERLVWLVLGLALASMGLALIQMLGDPAGPAYLYQDTNGGSGVGLFANRNHQAAFLACLPAIAAVAALRQRRLGRGRRGLRALRPALAVGGLILMVVPMILLTGSRAGLIAGLAGLAGLAGIVGRQRAAAFASRFSQRARAMLGLGVAAGLTGIVAATIWAGRAEAVTRLVGTSAEGEMRLRTLPSVIAMIRAYAPWGAGIGAFKPAYRVFEADSVLAPVMMNHAHNDWLELAATAGLPGLALLAVAIGLWLAAAYRAWRGDPADPAVPLVRLGVIVMGIMALVSLSDYPLRVPSLGCLFALAAVWACSGAETFDAAAGGRPDPGDQATHGTTR